MKKDFYDSEDCSIEERILDIFLEYINEYPIFTKYSFN